MIIQMKKYIIIIKRDFINSAYKDNLESLRNLIGELNEKK